MNPLCFILMPFDKKTSATGLLIDFDAIYASIIKPAVIAAQLEPIRADEEVVNGIIHKPMFERLVLCEYAIADLTSANANVFYELGLRHAVRKGTTQLIFAEGQGQLPFDVAMLRALPYKLDKSGKPAQAEQDCAELTQRLKNSMVQECVDSPVFQLLEKFPEADVSHLKTDVFRQRTEYAASFKEQLLQARKQNRDAVQQIQQQLGDIRQVEAGVVIDLLLSYRAVGATDLMIELVALMDKPLTETVMVQEQLAFALNRQKRREEAIRVLEQVLDKHGPSSESYGLLGRVYKDSWDDAKKAGNNILANGYLKKAIATYLKGFEADWRDAYPGINAVTLMEMLPESEPRQATLLPIVRYAVERRIAQGKPDYWDFATQLELAVLANDQAGAEAALADALAHKREAWEGETTARNLGLIGEVRAGRGIDVGWVGEVGEALNMAANS